MALTAFRPAAILALGVAGGFGQDGRMPVPSDKAQAQAEKSIREIFSAEYAVRTPAGQQKLAKKLLDQGRETKDDAAARYVLLREAGDLAGRGGDAELLIQSIDELCNGYQVDALVVKESSYSKAVAQAARPEDAVKLANALLQLTTAATDADRFDVASKAVQGGLAAAKKAKDVGLASRAEGAAKTASELRAAYDSSAKAEQTLAATPDDPGANQARGEYLCLVKGQWEQGLVFLSKGPDGALKSVAQKELKSPTQPAELTAVADEWYELAQKEKNALKKNTIAARARTTYERALEGAVGLGRAKIEKRLAELPRPKAALPGLVGYWSFDEGAGTVARDRSGKGNQGTLKSTAWAIGTAGRALSLNGKDSFVDFGTAGLPDLQAPKTVAFYYYHESIPGPEIPQAQIILSFVSTNSGPSGLAIGFWQSKVRLWTYGGGVVGEAPPPAPRAWHHFAYAHDGSEGRIYLDGALKEARKGRLPGGPCTNLTLGRWAANDVRQFFNGLVDELQIYDRALAEAEIKSLAK